MRFRVLIFLSLLGVAAFLNACSKSTRDSEAKFSPFEVSKLDFKLFVVFESTTNRLIFKGNMQGNSEQVYTLNWKIKAKTQVWDQLVSSTDKSEFVFLLNNVTYQDRVHPIEILLNDILVSTQKLPPTPSLTFVSDTWVKDQPISVAWSLPRWTPETALSNKISLTGFQEAPGPFNSFDFEQSIDSDQKSGVYKLDLNQMVSLESQRTLRMRLCLKRLYAPQNSETSVSVPTEMSSCSFLKNLPYSNISKI